MEIRHRFSPSHFFILSIIFSLFLVFSILALKPIKPFLPYLNFLLGTEKPTSYLILLGNDAETRANGGFAGSYAKLIITNRKVQKQSPSSNNNLLFRIFRITPTIDLSFQDIYVPNGQLQGYVAPPAPVQEAFQHGTWQLANADWEPDFPTAATTIRWFMEKGDEINPDNLIILNLTTIKKILDVVGSFTVSEYNAQITPDNLYLFLQGKAEVNFFPGSTQKKDALTAVGHSFKNAILNLPLRKKLKIAQILYQDLQNQNIVANSTNQDFQALLEKKNFAGKLTSSTPDTFLMIEVNLGANKANAYITRQTTHKITFQNNQTTHFLAVNFQNSSPEANPNPPFHYGGDYKFFLRFYIPSNAQNIQIATPSSSIQPVKISMQSPIITQKYDLTEIGLWQITPTQNQSTITLSYSLPVSAENYSLTILKQHGLVTSPQTINIGDKTYETKLENDYSLN